jgi:hypothetical protein
VNLVAVIVQIESWWQVSNITNATHEAMDSMSLLMRSSSRAHLDALSGQSPYSRFMRSVGA